ncbi:hypothetical protein TSO5_17195 [Azospirillum sp. TSO5]|nr:hypothetical protein TSO5_17195 [Azospirillum sp. TSO5]
MGEGIMTEAAEIDCFARAAAYLGAIARRGGADVDVYKEVDRDGFDYDGMSFDGEAARGELRIYSAECIKIGADVGGRPFTGEFRTLEAACLAVRLLVDGAAAEAEAVPPGWESGRDAFAVEGFFDVTAKALRFFRGFADIDPEGRGAVRSAVGNEGMGALAKIAEMLRSVELVAEGPEEDAAAACTV